MSEHSLSPTWKQAQTYIFKNILPGIISMVINRKSPQTTAEWVRKTDKIHGNSGTQSRKASLRNIQRRAVFMLSEG